MTRLVPVLERSIWLSVVLGVTLVARADELGGRTYGTSDLALGGNYSYATEIDGATTNHVHAWTNANAWSAGNITINNPTANGSTLMRLAAGCTNTFMVAAAATLGGNGYVEGRGTLEWAATEALRLNGGHMSFTNGGVFRITQPGRGSDGIAVTIDTGGSSAFRFNAGAALVCDLPANSDTAYIRVDTGNAGDPAVRFEDGLLHVRKGYLRVDGGRDTISSKATLQIEAGATLGLDGFRRDGSACGWGSVSATGDGVLQLGTGNTGTGCDVRMAGVWVLDMHVGGVVWTNTDIYGDNSAGGVTNTGDFYFRYDPSDSSASIDAANSIGFKFITAGDGNFYFDSATTEIALQNDDNILLGVADGGTFHVRNTGRPSTGCRFMALNRWNYFRVFAGGVLRCELPDATNETGITAGSTGCKVDVKTGGAIEVLRGTLKLRPGGAGFVVDNATPTATLPFTIKLVDPDGSGAGVSELDLDNLPVGGFTTLAASGRLDLRGPDVALTDDGTDCMHGLATVDGTLALHERHVFTRSGDMSVAGGLEFGLNAPSGAPTNLVVTGEFATTDTVEVAVVNSGGLASGTYCLVNYGTLSLHASFPAAFSLQMPDGFSGSLVNDTANNRILLQVGDSGKGTIFIIR